MNDSELKFLNTLDRLESQRKELVNSVKDYKVGKYEVSSLCIQTNPCKHYVKDTTTGKTYIMSKSNIFLLCLWSLVHIPHFYGVWYTRNN